MKPLFYTTLIVKRPITETDMPIYTRISKLFSHLHHNIRDGKKLAVAFPEMFRQPGVGNLIRFFGESEKDVTETLEYFANDMPNFELIADFSPVKNIEDNDIKGYEYYAKFRIPCKKNSKKFSKDPDAQRKQLELRKKRIAQSQALPFVNVSSKSTERRFKLFIEKGVCSKDYFGEPDGYGLSRKNNIIALPTI